MTYRILTRYIGANSSSLHVKSTKSKSINSRQRKNNPLSTIHYPLLQAIRLPFPAYKSFHRLILCQPKIVVKYSRFPVSVFGSLPEFPFIISRARSEEHTSELQSHGQFVCRLLLK